MRIIALFKVLKLQYHQPSMKKKSTLLDIEILAELPVRVDYLLLEDRFSHYKHPKKKIFDLKSKGYLRQIKRSQYFNLKSKHLETTPYEVIANSIYFPSYVSLEWALQKYGVIADRVSTVTSVTSLRSQEFETPYAPYSYLHLTKNRYPIGYTLNLDEGYLIAKPEKALLDYVNLKTKNLALKNEEDIQEFLNNDLRLDFQEFLNIIKLENLQELLPFYHRNSKEYRLLKFLIRQKERTL